jgi:CubicO group peptidase (beta-lactamase class C family)
MIMDGRDEDGPRGDLRGGRARLVAAALVVVVAVVLAPAPMLAQSEGNPDLRAAPHAGLASGIRALERELAADVVRDSVGSVAAAAFVADEVVWRGAFGWRDRGTRTLAWSGTIYRAGSLSKVVTALVLLRLVDDGVVSLDERVVTHLPEIARLGAAAGIDSAGARRITYRQLATHTAGLAREPDRGVYGRGRFREWKRKAVAAVPETRLVAEPGSVYGYSNIGFGILGVALERAAGRPFEVLADSLVFRPLGMRSTSFVLVADDRRRVATGYVNLPGDTADPRVPRVEHRGRGYRVPSGGLYSTTHDLARLGMAVTGALPIVSDSPATAGPCLDTQPTCWWTSSDGRGWSSSGTTTSARPTSAPRPPDSSWTCGTEADESPAGVLPPAGLHAPTDFPVIRSPAGPAGACSCPPHTSR